MKNILYLFLLILLVSCQKELEWTDKERRDNVNTSLGCIAPKFKQDGSIIGHVTSYHPKGEFWIFPEDKTQGPFSISVDGGKTFLPNCAPDPNGNYTIGFFQSGDYEICIRSAKGCLSTIFKARLETR